MNRFTACLNLVPLLLASTLLLSCQSQDSQSQFSEEDQPLDGSWEMRTGYSLGQLKVLESPVRHRVIIKDAAIYYDGTEAPFIRQLLRLPNGSYEGLRVWPGWEVKTTLVRVSQDEFTEELRLVSMPEGLRDRLAVTGKTYYRYIRLSDEGLPVMEDRGTQEVAGQPMNVELSSLEEYRAQIATERISLDSGAVATFERSRTVEHSVELTSTGSLEGSLGVNLINQVRGEVRGKIEKRIGRSFKESETFRNSVTLDGTVSPHWKLIWFEVGRSGAAEVKSADGNTETVRFRFAEGVELEVKAILPAR